ncbi:MAG TPA: hypothetical protein VGO63_01125 [Candidatus Paceibacterota bacterium]|jgi:hypothetical protein|nr:hypothetical protein [Candidatus Paceibacterota bacterium]
MKKVLFIIGFAIVSVGLALADYYLTQKFSGSSVAIYNVTLAIELIDWSVKSGLLLLIFIRFIKFIKTQEPEHSKISAIVVVVLGTFVVPFLTTFAHVLFSHRGPIREALGNMLWNRTMTRWAMLAHLIVSATLAIIGFVYVFFLNIYTKRKLKIKIESDKGTNEDD